MTTLEWERRDSYYLSTICGRYTVSRAVSMDRVVFTAWRVADKAALGYVDNAAKAKALCQADADKNNRRITT